MTGVMREEDTIVKGQAVSELGRLRSRRACQASAAEAYLVEIEKARRVLSKISGKGLQINGELPPEDEWPTEANWPVHSMWELFEDAVAVTARISDLEDRLRQWGALPRT